MIDTNGEHRRPAPCAIVIFGASGDLTHRKLLPALWNLHMERRLPEEISIVGMARSPNTNDGFRAEARQSVEKHSRFREVDSDEWNDFAQGLFYHQGQYDNPKSYEELKALLERLCMERGSCGNQFFYLAIPPSGYAEVAEQLGRAGLGAKGQGGGWSRVLIEKPFGRNLASAHELNATLRDAFNENQIYRIDHYLGKETVQNLMVLRFANGIFEPTWNRRYVDNVQISVAEDLGVEGRGAYYEESGALRDMVQNHLMQVLCLVAMEPPSRLDERAVRNEKIKVLEAIRPIPEDEVSDWTVRGQYTAGEIEGKPVPGYREEPGVSPSSRTETYAAVKFLIDNWRWAGVPFYLRSGKRLPRRVTEVQIQFRRAPHLLFRDYGEQVLHRNILTIRIQPDEGIALRFAAKVPGTGMEIRPVEMNFDYCQTFHKDPPEAYERLLLDAMFGEITLFIRDDWMEQSWSLMDPILKAWYCEACPPPAPYTAGSWGPKAADDLLARDGRAWWNPVGE